MPRRPAVNLFDLVDDLLDGLMDQARGTIRAAIRDSGIPTQIPGPAPAQGHAQDPAPPRQKRARKGQDPARDRAQTPNHYSVLEVTPTASPEAINGAYRALVRKYHPDTHKGKRFEEKMRAINGAYSVIGYPEKRAAYDRELKKTNR